MLGAQGEATQVCILLFCWLPKPGVVALPFQTCPRRELTAPVISCPGIIWGG